MSGVRLQINLEASKGYDPKIDKYINQLQLLVEDNEDKMELSDILLNYLSYPDTQMAQLHRNANKMGASDLKKSLQQSQKSRLLYERCQCCEMIVQEKEIDTCGSNFNQIAGLGTSTVVFFKTIVNVIYLLIVMTLVYSTFSLVTNISIGQSSDKHNHSELTNFLIFSLKSKSNEAVIKSQTGELYFYISSWLGVLMLLIWSFMFFCFQKQAFNYEMKEQKIRNVSDYSIIIENIPYGMSKEELQDQVTQYLAGFHKKGSFQEIQRIKIEKYNVGHPFNFKVDDYKDQKLRNINKEINKIKEQFRNWIIERRSHSIFSKSKEYRQEKYQRFNTLLQQKSTKTSQILKNMHKNLNQTSSDVLTTVFVTFQTIEQRNFMLYYNSNDVISRVKRLFLSLFNCFYFSSRLKLYHEGKIHLNIRIQAASEPQDIIWGNIGVSECERISRLSLTFIVSIGTLILSLAIVIALSTIQFLHAESRYISFLISLVISGCNFLIIKMVQLSTSFQRTISMNNYQISLTMKSVMALLLNSIILPLLVNYFVKGKNVYNKGGLTEDIFILAITSSFVPPLLNLLDPLYIFVTLRAKYYNSPLKKLYLNQSELNRLNEKMQFQLGYHYIYILNVFMFVCFYVSLQPIIPVFAIAGLILMYWVDKYTLLRRCQRPVPGTESVSLSMYQMIYLGAICYAFGSLTWSAFLPDGNFRNSFVPNIVSACLAFIIFVFPYRIFVKKENYCSQSQPYQKQRIFFTSQYDRMNPATKEEALHSFRSDIRQTILKFRVMPSQEKQQIINNLEKKICNNFYKNNNPANIIFGNEEDVQISNLFYGECRNSINPGEILSFIKNQSTFDSIQQQPNEIRPKSNKRKPKKQAGNLKMNILASKEFGSKLISNQEDIKNVYRSSRISYLANIREENENTSFHATSK